MENFNTVPDYGLSWLEASGDHADIVLSTRVRLARNLQGHAFGPRARVNDREAVLRRFKESSARSEILGHGTFLELADMETRTRRILLERRLVTRELDHPHIIAHTEPIVLCVSYRLLDGLEQRVG